MPSHALARAEIVNLVASQAHVSKQKAAAAVDAVFKEMAERLKGGEGVRVAGLGTVTLKPPGRSGLDRSQVPSKVRKAREAVSSIPRDPFELFAKVYGDL